jgi:hypothetical protein
MLRYCIIWRILSYRHEFEKEEWHPIKMEKLVSNEVDLNIVSRGSRGLILDLDRSGGIPLVPPTILYYNCKEREKIRIKGK